MPPLPLPRSLLLLAVLTTAAASPALAQVKATVPAGITPPWNKGILAISPESYWNAVECGKQGGENPPCVFWDAGLCRNDDFVLAMYTPYKMVAYEAWRLVRQGQSEPTPSYPEAQRTRITVGVTPARGAKNPIAKVVVRRGKQTIEPVTVSNDETGGRFTFDYPAFAPGAMLTLDLIGKSRTISCVIAPAVLARMR
jgi:hypothetical protein